MNKRSDSIRSLFASRPPELSADNAGTEVVSPSARVASGSVRSMRESFTSVERENEALRQELAKGGAIVEIDPALIDSSPVADRFASEADDEGFEALKNSIAERGQEVPVLLRNSPDVPGRYQSAYGHRRVRAARALGRPVRALIRPLTEEELVVAQGLENSARQDLTFIERAVFALRLEEKGFERRVLQDALSVDKAEISKLISVARDVPSGLVEAIGRAPKTGRGRWLQLAEAFKKRNASGRVRKAMLANGFKQMPSDERFLALLSAALETGETAPKVSTTTTLTHHGLRIASRIDKGDETRFVIAPQAASGFADFLAEHMPELYARFTAPREDMGEPD